MCKIIFTTLFLYQERMAQFLADPFRLQRVSANHHRISRGGVDGLVDLQPERIATAQLARVDPTVLAVVGQRRAEIAHETVVLRAVGDEELVHSVLLLRSFRPAPPPHLLAPGCWR
ncbi:MAG TPA: hypothetical protein PL166_00695 [Candidatus Contendobacter sp.]|nr:hypothetical protein [Candidatus Contendobacter sp.]